LTTSPTAAPAARGLRLWPDEYEDLRAEARAVVKAAMGAVPRSGTASGPSARAADPAARAEAARETIRAFGSPVPEGENREIAGRRCRVFRPEHDAGWGVLYLHFHGGGMIAGVPEISDTRNLEISRRHGIAVISASYRLAPEHPFPAGADDCFAVARWLLENGEEEYGARRIIVGGESAGGYLAAAVLLRIRDELGAVDRVAGANLVYGVYDWGPNASHLGLRATGGPDLTSPQSMTVCAEAYLPGRTDSQLRDPVVSPAFADLHGLPPALLSAGTSDHLLDDTLLLASRWSAAGGDVELFVGPDLPHGFDHFPCELTRRWTQRTAEWFDRVLRGQPRKEDEDMSDCLADVEAIKQVKARYLRSLDTKDWDGLRLVLTHDMVMDTSASDGTVVTGADAIVTFLLKVIGDVTTVHHGHMPEIELTSATTARGTWSMEDMLRWPDGRQMHGYGHYHETYERAEDGWRIKTLTLTRLRVDWT
jgi:acetyl esterase/lipase